MVIAGALAVYALAFWGPTLLPRGAGLAVAVLLLAGCAYLVAASLQHVPSRTHFDIAREAGAATGAGFALAPLAAVAFLLRGPEAARGTGARLLHLAVALGLSAAVGAATFFGVFPRV